MVGLEKEAPCWEPKGEMFVFFYLLQRILLFFFVMLRSLPGKIMEEISQNISRFNIHALVIIGGFEVSLGVCSNLPTSQNSSSSSLPDYRPTWEVWSWFRPERSTRRYASPWWSSPPPSPTTSPALTSASAPTPPSTPSHP